MEVTQIIAIAVFVGVMVLIISEKIHRALAALIGALIAIILGIINFETAIEAIDWNTLGVLCGMMMFVSVAKRSGIFEFIAVKAAKLAKGKPWMIMVYFVIITAVLSALLDNVTTILLVCPMTLIICKKLDLNPMPFFMTQVLASNIGGTATLIGDPPNIMIGSAAGISFLDFLIYDGAAVLVILAVVIVAFRFMYAKKLIVTPEKIKDIMAMDEHGLILSKSLFIQSIVMIGIVTIAFSLHGVLHIESSIIALCAAAILMLIGRANLEQTVHDVEWPTIAFFLGLFIVVGGLENTGVIHMLAMAIMDLSGGDTVILMLVILWASAILSAVLDNIPFVATAIPIIVTMQNNGIDVWPLWWALSLGACLGGNGTLIGASANVVLAGIAEKEGYHISFISFLKTGAPIMLITVVISTVYLLIRFQ